MLYHIRSGICLFVLLISHISFASHQTQRDDFTRISSTILQPVYGPLAEQIVDDFDLADMEGIGIDLGSGPGNLIIELCRITKNLHWVNADINPDYFPGFIKRARDAGFGSRVSAMYADAVNLPFRNNYAEIIVSRGSFQMWDDLKAGLSEVYRVLKPGGVTYIGRGFSTDLPVEVARAIRQKQKKRDGGLKYDVNETAEKMKAVMKELNIQDFRIIIPKPEGAENIKYGLWLEFHKP
jgi:ubiquinone/menaquinone biosynthesis C-methylase UbiE